MDQVFQYVLCIVSIFPCFLISVSTVLSPPCVVQIRGFCELGEVDKALSNSVPFLQH